MQKYYSRYLYIVFYVGFPVAHDRVQSNMAEKKHLIIGVDPAAIMCYFLY
jgi:hypothetical protein